MLAIMIALFSDFVMKTKNRQTESFYIYNIGRDKLDCLIPTYLQFSTDNMVLQTSYHAESNIMQPQQKSEKL